MLADSNVWNDWIDWLPSLLDGLRTSVLVTGLSLLAGLPAGLALGLGMVARSKPLRYVTIAVVEIGRGIPLLVVLYLLYFGLPGIGVVLSSWWAAVAGIGFSTAAYTSEIFRAGILSVPRGHLEAARSLGLGWVDEARFVVIPQTFRAITPALMSYSIIIFQATSLGYAIALPELLNAGYRIGSVTFQFISVFTLVGFLYAVISITASRAVDAVHHRLTAV